MKHMMRGSVYKCGDRVTAYQIIGQNRWALGLNEQELGKWAMEGVCPEVLNLENGFKEKGCSIIVAGQDFGGGGKSIEHPIAAMQGAGIKLLIADSFSRYCFRNAINRGLPAILCPGVTKIVSMGDVIEADLVSGKIQNCTTGKEMQGVPLSDLVLEFAACGGMLSYYRKKLSKFPEN